MTTTFCAAFQDTAVARAREPALRGAGGQPQLRWGQAAAEVERLAGALAAAGVKRGDTVALLARNVPAFNLVDAAAMHLGAIPWSVYATSSREQIAELLHRAGSRVVIAEDQFLPALAGAAVDRVLVLDEHESWPAAPPGFDFDAEWQAVTPDDVLTLIWTSGTTGPPKGVELTHRAMHATLTALAEIAPAVGEAGRIVSYLPSAHVADRWAAHYSWMLFGHTMTCLPDAAALTGTLAEVRPTVWGSVPRVFEKLQAALEAQGITDPAGLAPNQTAAVRTGLGLDQTGFLVVGAAPLAPEMHAFFEGLGLPLCEVWGMSETCGLLTVNPPGARRVGTVGPPLPGARLQIAADGEVLARGPMLMRGYRGDPERTAEAIDGEGWLHTGDVGTLDDDGYLTIVDRKKELIINAAGKNMSPLAIEAALKTAGPLIGQACAIGDRRPYNVALLLLDPDAAGAWAAANDRAHLDYAAISREPSLREAVAAEVAAANARLSRVEQIKRWALLDADWLPSSDELTPTMKLRRRQISGKHAATIDALYAAEAPAA